MTWAKTEHKRCDRETERQTDKQTGRQMTQQGLSVGAHCRWNSLHSCGYGQQERERTLIVPKLHRWRFAVWPNPQMDLELWVSTVNFSHVPRIKQTTHFTPRWVSRADMKRYSPLCIHTHTHTTNNLHFISVYLMHQLSLSWYATTENTPSSVPPRRYALQPDLLVRQCPERGIEESGTRPPANVISICMCHWK